MCNLRGAKLIDILKISFFKFVISIPTFSGNFKSHRYFLGILYKTLCCKGVVTRTSKKEQNKNTKFNTKNALKIESNTIYRKINFHQGLFLQRLIIEWFYFCVVLCFYVSREFILSNCIIHNMFA